MSHDPSHWDYEIKTIKAISLNTRVILRYAVWNEFRVIKMEFAVCLYTMGCLV
jgi:hypothetical protein